MDEAKARAGSADPRLLQVTLNRELNAQGLPEVTVLAAARGGPVWSHSTGTRQTVKGWSLKEESLALSSAGTATTIGCVARLVANGDIAVPTATLPFRGGLPMSSACYGLAMAEAAAEKQDVDPIEAAFDNAPLWDDVRIPGQVVSAEIQERAARANRGE